MPKEPLPLTAGGYKPLYDGIVELLDSARRAAGRAVNSMITTACWEMGRRIVEEEQRGRRKAAYGEQLIDQLARDLTDRFGRGFSRTNVFQIRQFYLAYQQIIQTPSGQSGAAEKVQTLSGQLPAFPLSWYVRLLSVQDSKCSPLLRRPGSPSRLVRAAVGPADCFAILRAVKGREASADDKSPPRR